MIIEPMAVQKERVIMNLERQKENFKNHKAIFTDYGNIKILDFSNPNSQNYRIRFLFEEDYYRLHISGDLGELIASNYTNMTYERFTDFVNDIGYFESKVDCHSRPFYFWDEKKARTDLVEMAKKDEWILFSNKYTWESDEERLNDIISDILCDFDEESGIGRRGYEQLSGLEDDIVKTIGKKETGILDLYILAFKLAKEQLEK